MIYKNTTTWDAEKAAMIPKSAGLPLDPSSGDVGHIENHTVVHELLAGYVFDPEIDSQIWKKTADNEWEGIDGAPSYDDSGLQVYLQEMEDVFIQSYGKSPMFYLVADLGWEQKEYTHPSEMPVGSTLYSGQKGLLGAVSGLALKSNQLRQQVEILDGENHTRRDEIAALTTDKETLEGKVSTLESDNSTLNATVSGLETNFGSLSSANDTLNSTVSTLEGNVTTLTSDKEALEGQVSTLESTIADLTARLEALENPTNPE